MKYLDVKKLDRFIGFMIATQLLIQLPAQCAGGMGGGGGGHGFGGGRAMVAAPGFVHGGNQVGGAGFGRFNRRFFNGGFGYGYPYGYDYGYVSDDDQIAAEAELAEEKRYNEAVQEQDKRRAELPGSAFVKNYNWPSDSQSTQTVAAKKPSVAARKSGQKAM